MKKLFLFVRHINFQKIALKFLVILAFIFSQMSFCEAETKPTIIVTPFENNAAIKLKNNLSMHDLQLIGELISYSLLKWGKFDVIYNDGDTLSSLVTGASNGIQGADYMLVGYINNLSTAQSGGAVNKMVNVSLDKYSVTCNLAAKIINLKTQEIVMTGKGKGKSSSALFEVSMAERNPYDTNFYALLGNYTKELSVKIGTNDVHGGMVYNAVAKAVQSLVEDKQTGLMTMGIKK